MRIARIAVASGVAAAAVLLSACGSDEGTASMPAPPPGAGESAPTTGPAAAPFGRACGAVPASGPGSFQDMAADPVATAASHNPQLSRLYSALQKANLVDTLNNAQNVTVFAPANVAFDQLPQATVDRMLADNAKLTKILTYHVVGRRVDPAGLSPGNFPSLEGATVSTSGTGQDVKINGNTSVLCGNVRTANATVYIIDSILKPPGT
jgi:uncharacterized surface protein with fasciclin (FAS1) repeats